MKALRYLAVALLTLAMAAPAFSGEVKRIDKYGLKPEMSSFIIVDGRKGSDWKGSEFKILGAVRPKGKIADFAIGEGWDKGAKIVIYCA